MCGNSQEIDAPKNFGINFTYFKFISNVYILLNTNIARIVTTRSLVSDIMTSMLVSSSLRQQFAAKIDDVLKVKS